MLPMISAIAAFVMIVAAPAPNESTSIVGIFVVSMPVNSLRFCTESVEAFALFSATDRTL